MNFSDRILSRTRSPKDPLPKLEKWIAASQSRDPATISPKILCQDWNPIYSSATGAIKVLFLGLFIPQWETWEIVEKIKQDAYFHQYEGNWEQVQEILEQVTDLSTFEEKIFQLMSPDDFFGNFLKECDRFLRRNLLRYHRIQNWKNGEPFKPVKKTVYRRGYRDKGSLRPSHQRGRNLGGDPGIDRRRKVKYGNLP